VQAVGQPFTIKGVTWQTAHPGSDFDVLAPDGSEIRVLVQVRGGSMVHCTLQPGQTTRAVRHQSVEELWYCVAGTGQVWRRSAEAHEFVDLRPGTALSIPVATDFQFRSSGDEPLEMIITTMPPWPGDAEATPVTGCWEPTR
jgi:mannose-6-phosphate isomerase-like protein (cupin superfamily)